MAEYCLECWNEMNGTDEGEENFIMSKDFDLCEGCGEFKPVIIKRAGWFTSMIKKAYCSKHKSK